MPTPLTISSSPQIHARSSTRSIMLWVLVALAPAGIWSIMLFGIRSAVVIATSTAVAVITEYILNAVSKRQNSIGDLSACVTGVLVGYNMPANVPLFIPIIASVFAIAVVKWSFGGLGANWMNPALAGRVFVFFSWGKAMTTWPAPLLGPTDSFTGATPLGAVKAALSNLPEGIQGPMDVLAHAGRNLTYTDLFMGRISGSLGEMSALLLLIGGLFLVILRIANWELPFFYLATSALFIWLFDGLNYGASFFHGDVAFHLLTGGIMMGAFFMATDMVTSPLTFKGRIIFACGCGFLTFLIRSFGSYPEGVSLSIIFMNILSPLIDRFVAPKKYGY